ncbi:hypothetical protein DXG01_006572 [Tephrocybe rancida]|nr:hypothetical protein DXG01_006572 [Tephrocybe rancida]
MTTPNSLGLDFDQLNIQDQPPPQPDVAPIHPTPDVEIKVEKKKPYVNTERVKTGGSQRDKLSEEALTERMARMKEQNEKIKQRRLDVQADEEAFRKTQESERAKLAQIRKVQEGVDRTREQNAKRKMDKIQSREWDSGKPTGDWKYQSKKTDTAVPPAAAEDTKKEDVVVPTEVAGSPPRDSSNWVRGAPRGAPPRGRGRGRGRGGSTSSSAPQRDTKPAADAKPTDAATPSIEAKPVGSAEASQATNIPAPASTEPLKDSKA